MCVCVRIILCWVVGARMPCYTAFGSEIVGGRYKHVVGVLEVYLAIYYVRTFRVAQRVMV